MAAFQPRWDLLLEGSDPWWPWDQVTAERRGVGPCQSKTGKKAQPRVERGLRQPDLTDDG